MKKVLFLPSWYPTLEKPLNGLFFQEQAEELQGVFDVRVLFVGFRPTGRKKAILFSLRKQAKRIALAGYVEGMGFEVGLPPFAGAAGKIAYILKWYEKLFGEYVLKYGKPDLLHAHGGLFAGIGSTFLKEKYSIPNLITEHHPILLKDFDQASARAYIHAMNRASATSTVSQYARRMLMMQAEHTFPFVHGNLVNESLYPLKARKSKDFTVGYVGYPSFNKDPFTFIEAVALLKGRHGIDCKAKMVIPEVNGDFRFHDIRQLIQEKGLSACIEVIPGLEKTELVKFYHSLSALVSTSYSETFGLVSAEAAACGIPVVATKSGGVEDFVDKQLGFLVDLKNAEGIADGLLVIQQHPERFSGAEMRKKVIMAYGKEAFRKNMTQIYGLVMGSAARLI